MKSSFITMLFCLVIGVFLINSPVFAQGFTRGTEIAVPETELNTGGTGAMVAGVDLDNDGLTEIYLVNDNWNDTPSELIPRIYKLERNQGGVWEVVWKAVAPVKLQNTWPPLVVGDLDKDGKKELIWGVVNFITDSTMNPYRILVYEVKGDGSDVLGISSGDNYLPNAKTTIVSEDDKNIRPSQFVLADVNEDTNDEIIFSDRGGESGDSVFFGVISVSNIPDNGDGSETWTLLTSALDFETGEIYNKWDAAVLGKNCYFFCEAQISKLYWEAQAWHFEALTPLAGGAAWLTSQTVDLNKDQTKEILTVAYDYADDTHKAVVLLQEDGDSLKQTELFNLASYWPTGSRGGVGSAVGDIDGDNYLDYIFGSRGGATNAFIFRLAYRGGDITNPASYELTVIDQEYAVGGVWNVISLADVDTEAGLEVLYTSSIDAGEFPDLGTKPIIVLKYSASAIGERDVNVISEYSLTQNYPNPFNPWTEFEFTLPRAAEVKISIYDINGRLINTLVNAGYPAGRYLVKWNGTDAAGLKVSSGTYFYTMEADQVTIARKMMLVK